MAYLNPAAEEVLGVAFQAVRGRGVQDALPDRLHPLRDVLLETLERHLTRQRDELTLSTVSGKELPVGISTNVLRHDDQVTGAVAVFQDLSAVREMEIQNRRNQTLAEVGALAAGIAHELRNGLSPISGSIEVLQRELKLEGENAQLMELMQTECARLNRFVTDLLSYSRERPLVKEVFDLGESLGELCEGLQRDPPARRQRPSSIGARGHHRAEGRPRAIPAGVAEPARNAMEAMAIRTLQVARHEADPQRVRDVHGRRLRHRAPDDLSRVAQPFFTQEGRHRSGAADRSAHRRAARRHARAGPGERTRNDRNRNDSRRRIGPGPSGLIMTRTRKR